MSDNLAAMLEQLSKEQTETEEQIRTLTVHVESVRVRRADLEKLIAWKAGDPVPALLTVPAPPVPHPLGQPVIADQDAIAIGQVHAAHGTEFVRSTELKKEFPHVNFQALFGRKLIKARGQGAGREYAVKA